LTKKFVAQKTPKMIDKGICRSKMIDKKNACDVHFVLACDSEK